MLIKKINLSKGFTLVESLVAVSILSLSIAATFTAVQAGLKSSIYAKDEITAFYLTQEAMEYIKGIRDANALLALGGSSADWLTNLVVTSAGGSGPCDYGKVCTVEPPSGGSSIANVSNCSSGSGQCPTLNQDTTTGTYSYSSSGTWKPTTFRREIEFQAISGSTVEVLVKITVSWKTSGVNKSFQVTQSLFNRQ